MHRLRIGLKSSNPPLNPKSRPMSALRILKNKKCWTFTKLRSGRKSPSHALIAGPALMCARPAGALTFRMKRTGKKASGFGTGTPACIRCSHRHASGHNPRGTKVDRVRQRFMHKLKYYVDKYDNGIQCVGCGRCVQMCPVNIDIRRVCNMMNSYDPEPCVCEVTSA